MRRIIASQTPASCVARLGVIFAYWVHILLGLLLWSIHSTIWTDPGGIPGKNSFRSVGLLETSEPRTDTKEWKRSPDPVMVQERTFEGQFRYDM